MKANKIRKRIPTNLEKELLYNSARRCCICRDPNSPIQIHHIDQNPSNNIYSNLVVICQNCHDEAHTTRTMSKNLTKNHILDAKKRWEEEVKEQSSLAMLPMSNISHAMWTFVNHEKLPRIFHSLGVIFNLIEFQELLNRGVIDKNGVPQFQYKTDKTGYITIYDRMDWDSATMLHNLYMSTVDNLIMQINPIELGAIWTKTEFRSLIKPGSICFAMRGFHFQSSEMENGEVTRIVYAKAKNIEVRMFANTRHMYGMSALLGHFVGHTFVAILLIAKYFENIDGKLILHATPLAMGSGFLSGNYSSPHKLRYGWAGR